MPRVTKLVERLGSLFVVVSAVALFLTACGNDTDASDATSEQTAAWASSAGNVSTPTPTPIEVYLRSISGTWQANVYQEDFAPYLMTIVITPATAKVDYPDLACGGSLVPQRVEGDSLVLTERIETGSLEECADGGTVRISREGTGLLWRWYWPDGTVGTEPALLVRR
jgi:hypothetical protein